MYDTLKLSIEYFRRFGAKSSEIGRIDERASFRLLLVFQLTAIKNIVNCQGKCNANGRMVYAKR